VGAITALVSNVFLSQGPWTPWQMAAWGGVGVGGALLSRAIGGRELGRVPLALVCALMGLAFGAVMDVYQWTLAARQDLPSYLAVSGSSLPYNVAHALGNVVFCLLIGPPFVRALRRYRRRFEVRWEPARAGAVAAAVLALAVALSAAPAHAASPAGRAARYLERAQNRDGGFGAAPGQRSSQLYTGWSALGLAAARTRPSVTGYLRRHAGALTEIGEVERTVLVLRAVGVSPRRLAGRNLVRDILRRRRSDGSISGFVSYTAFGVLALRAAGVSPSAGMLAYLRRAQSSDGGFGVSPGVPSDSDMTGATLQALAATGRAHSRSASRAVAWLRGTLNPDGGFGARRDQSSNAQSTSYAVQGLVAAGARGSLVSRAIGYLVRLQTASGSVRYSRTSAQTPVWVTAQALMALKRKPLPIAPVKRGRRVRKAVTAVVAKPPHRSSRRRAARPKPAARPARAATPSKSQSVGTARRSKVAPVAASQDGPAPLLLVGVGVGAVALVLLGRRLLRRRLARG
jgi:energy-coupling factor transport system substrate-specific component